jgi:hypothetical protein
MKRRAKRSSVGNKAARWMVSRSHNKGGYQQQHVQQGKGGASTTGRRVFSSGRRIPDTSGWGSCPRCCTWPSSWEMSCRSFYNCFSCKWIKKIGISEWNVLTHGDGFRHTVHRSQQALWYREHYGRAIMCGSIWQYERTWHLQYIKTMLKKIVIAGIINIVSTIERIEA